MANNTQANVLYSNDVFKQYLLQLSTDLVWKSTLKATAAELEDTNEAYRVELFIEANRGLLTFEIIRSFPRVVLKNCGVLDNYIELYASDKNQIPVADRPAIVAEYQRALCMKNSLTGQYAYWDAVDQVWTSVYTEKNNYYRMLMGLPDYGDTEFIYNTDARWSTTTPVHQMLLTSRIEMENAGVLDQLIAQHPNKPYLKYLGKRRVDFYKARIAPRFDILWRNTTTSDVLNKDWDQCYENSRQLTTHVYYSNAFRVSSELYENFLAMSILFMTIQQMQHMYLKADVTRDFYDTESLKVVYDSYQVPFYNEVPLEYHRKIVKNINHFISTKGSDQVFLDLFNIFDLGSMELYNYFLTKRHKLDPNNNPLFLVETDDEGHVVYDAKGRPVLKKETYELVFSKVKLGQDPALAVADYSNDVEYKIITEPDPYWIEDENLQKKLNDADFNYLESKYIGVQIVFDLMKITYENATIFRLITDNKDLTSALTFRWTDLGLSASLFDLFIYLACIYCRAFGYDAYIGDYDEGGAPKIPAIMDTMGYNFEQAINILNEKVLTSEILSTNTELIDLMGNMSFAAIDSVNEDYDKIIEIRDLIIEGFTNARTMKEFDAYRDLYRSLLISREVTATYTNPNTGEVFHRFTDVLDYYNPDLMQRYLLVEDDEIGNEMSLIIAKLEELISSLRYLPFSAGMDSSKMIVALFKILKFFKSAKAELLEYNVTYVIRMRGMNFFKMMDKIQNCIETVYIDDPITYVDLITLIQELVIHRRDVQKFYEEMEELECKAYLYDYIHTLEDELHLWVSIMDVIQKDNQIYVDFITEINDQGHFVDRQILTDQDRIEVLYDILMDPTYVSFLVDTEMLMSDYLIDVLHLTWIQKDTSVFQEVFKVLNEDHSFTKDRIQVLVDCLMQRAVEIQLAKDQGIMTHDHLTSAESSGVRMLELLDKKEKFTLKSQQYQLRDPGVHHDELIRLDDGKIREDLGFQENLQQIQTSSFHMLELTENRDKLYELLSDGSKVLVT